MRVIVWRRFNMLERRLRSTVTVSLARENDKEEIKRKMNIFLRQDVKRESILCIPTLYFFLFHDLHAIPTPFLNPLNRHRHSIR